MITSESTISPASTACTFPVHCSGGIFCPECDEITRIDRKLSRLSSFWRQKVFKKETREKASSLIKHRRTVLSKINVKRDPLSSKLPVEVACQIFEAYVGLYAKDLGSPAPGPLETKSTLFFQSFPTGQHLRLGAVCQWWRQIAWSHPYLWNNLYINLDLLRGRPHGPTLVWEWLWRSGSLPLDIRVANLRGAGVDVDRKILEILGVFTQRWRSLDLGASSMAIPTTNVDATLSGFPSPLRRLLLHGDFNYDIPVDINEGYDCKRLSRNTI